MLQTPNGLVYGFHGTSTALIEHIHEHGFTPSTGTGHWLGAELVYFFEDRDLARGWAEHWAVARHGGEPAVFQCIIDLDSCLDLTQTAYKTALHGFGQAILDRLDPEVVENMRQNHGFRQLDSLVLTQAMRVGLHPTGGYKSIRAICAARNGPAPSRVYPKDGPLYSAGGLQSWLDWHDHIQIGVADQSMISGVDRIL